MGSGCAETLWRSFYEVLDPPGGPRDSGRKLYFSPKINLFMTQGRTQSGTKRQAKGPKGAPKGPVTAKWVRSDVSWWVLGVRKRSGGRFMRYGTHLEVPGIRGENFIFHPKIGFFVTCRFFSIFVFVHCITTQKYAPLGNHQTLSHESNN